MSASLHDPPRLREQTMGRIGMNAVSPSSSSRVTQSVSEPRPTVFIVDDDVSVRESLEALIEAWGFLAKVFASAEEFLSHSRQSSGPSCVVLDLGLPDLNGLEVQKRLGAGRMHMPIIFITGQGDIPATVKAMKAGAVEFLTKPCGAEVLLSAIEGAIERSRAWTTEQTELQVLRDRYESLTRRERDVMRLVVAGFLNKQVGAELGVSEITVKAHRGRVMRKMKVRSLAKLVGIAARVGLPTGNRD
jgi:FixJ family two-component response regulator